jgi:hypothetical protein
VELYGRGAMPTFHLLDVKISLGKKRGCLIQPCGRYRFCFLGSKSGSLRFDFSAELNNLLRVKAYAMDIQS